LQRCNIRCRRSSTLGPVIEIPDVPATLHSERERGRIQVQGQSTDDNSDHTLLIIHEADGSWTVHGLGAPGITLPPDKMVALAESILRRAR
jgi:hypothetical protein